MAGRPKRAQIPENLVEMFASKGCTDKEISTLISATIGQKVTMEELQRRCGDVIELGRARMRKGLKEAQIAMTQGDKPNPIMLIWLGKQYLGQADKVESNNKQLLEVTVPELWTSAFGVIPKPKKSTRASVN